MKSGEFLYPLCPNLLIWNFVYMTIQTEILNGCVRSLKKLSFCKERPCFPLPSIKYISYQFVFIFHDVVRQVPPLQKILEEICAWKPFKKDFSKNIIFRKWLKLSHESANALFMFLGNIYVRLFFSDMSIE